MKKFALVAALVAPLAIAAPAFAQGVGDASGYVGASAATTSVPAQAREFTARHAPAAGAVQIDREAVSSSAFSSSN